MPHTTTTFFWGHTPFPTSLEVVFFRKQSSLPSGVNCPDLILIAQTETKVKAKYKTETEIFIFGYILLNFKEQNRWLSFCAGLLWEEKIEDSWWDLACPRSVQIWDSLLTPSDTNRLPTPPPPQFWTCNWHCKGMVFPSRNSILSFSSCHRTLSWRYSLSVEHFQ